jgi:hypothetical protein
VIEAAMGKTYIRAALASLAFAGLAGAAQAQQFHLYLLCKGEIKNKAGKSEPAYIDLALRDNNMTALVQRSNVLPVGERMKYTASQTHYALVYATPRPGTVIYSNWFGSVLFVAYPEFRRVVETRLSVDRQTAALEGEMMALHAEQVGVFNMMCDPKQHSDMPAPKF